MARALYETQPSFRKDLDECQEVLRPHLDVPLLDLLFAPPERSTLLEQTLYLQPALFALEYALARQWLNWGVEPAFVLGHSLGEYAAAAVAGLWPWQDALRLVAERARLMHQLPGGAMATVLADEAGVRPYVAGQEADLSIAACNGPHHTTIAGPTAMLEPVLARLQQDGYVSQRLAVSHAFHSPGIEPILDALERGAALLSRQPMRFGFVSTLTGWLARSEELTGPYWRQHSRCAVQFRAGINTLREQGVTVFIEIGSGATLLKLGSQCLGHAAVK
jgi:acyl transferase domain-containing protein